MKIPNLRVVSCAVAALVLATLGFGAPPKPQEAFDYAKSVVLVKRVLEGKVIHSYVKEVWRYDAGKGSLPAIGSEYGQPTPFVEEMKNPERDAIAFRFDEKRPAGLPIGWTVQVLEDGMVMPFRMQVEDLRNAFLKTQPKS